VVIPQSQHGTQLGSANEKNRTSVRSATNKKANQIRPVDVDDDNNEHDMSFVASFYDFNDSSIEETTRSIIRLRLSHMLHGYYLTSWKGMLIEKETRDEDVKHKYKEENECSDLMKQETLYMQMDVRLPRFACNLQTSLSSLSNISLFAMARILIQSHS
jgi:hypothetical protein